MDRADHTIHTTRPDVLHPDMRRLLRLLAVYLQAYRLYPRAYRFVRKPHHILLIVNLASNEGGRD